MRFWGTYSNQAVTNCHAFKMKATDGKMRSTFKYVNTIDYIECYGKS